MIRGPPQWKTVGATTICLANITIAIVIGEKTSYPVLYRRPGVWIVKDTRYLQHGLLLVDDRVSIRIDVYILVFYFPSIKRFHPLCCDAQHELE